MERVKLGDVATYINGYAFKPEDWADNGVEIIRIQNLTGKSREINYYEGDFDSKYEVNPGDVLISWSASLGVYVWKKERSVLNQHIFKVIFNKLEINKDFFVYQVATILNKAGVSAHGATMRHLTRPVFDSLPFRLTDIDSQNRIAGVLNYASTLIKLRQQQLTQLDTLVKARFVEMFGDPITNENGWREYRWSDVLLIKNGRNQKKIEQPNGEYAICGSGGVIGRGIEYITEAESVVIGRKGNINKPMLMHERYWNVDTAFGLEPHSEVLDVNYLYIFCEMYNFESLNKTVTIPSLTKSDLLNIKIPIPPLSLQNQFADFVKQVDKSKVAVQKALDEAQMLFDSLMQEYFE
ncbi:restriction endonuclease subunit S [Alloscardovia venturai]|uniref:Restriction endonuclease subunit S n=1 Tax=Alloscardovia venturai TaxID=1769421 RepID=A0ABW2Y5A7_9BIFI